MAVELNAVLTENIMLSQHYVFTKSILHQVHLRPQARADPSLANAEGDTPLDWAAFVGNGHMVADLLKAGADIETKDNAGDNAKKPSL